MPCVKPYFSEKKKKKKKKKKTECCLLQNLLLVLSGVKPCDTKDTSIHGICFTFHYLQFYLHVHVVTILSFMQVTLRNRHRVHQRKVYYYALIC